MTPDQAAIDALAEAWAVIDGKRDEFTRERHMDLDDGANTGSFEGYRSEASTLLELLRSQGFDIVRKE